MRDINTALNLTDYPPAYYPEVERRMIGSEQTLHLMENYKDIAVWGIHTFTSNEQNQEVDTDEFFQYWRQYTVESLQFLTKNGIKRLILDLSTNGGGQVNLGLDTVQKFFPLAKPFYGVDYRRSPFVDAFNIYWNTSDYLTKLDGSAWKDGHEFLNPPIAKAGDYFTKIGRLYPLEDLKQEVGSGESPFPLENIVVVRM